MITQDSVLLGTTKIDYSIVYSERRKNASLAVYPVKYVEILVPSDLERGHIQRLVKKKAHWVMKQLAWFDEIARADSSKEYVNGETFLYLGRQFRLKIIKGGKRPQASIEGGYLTVSLPDYVNGQKTALVKAAIWYWYREETARILAEIISKYSKKLGISPPNLMIKNQSKRWGSCTSKNQLIFNFRILMAPMRQLEYIVAHELCHICHKSHSADYWKLLESILPDFSERKEVLRTNGWQYIL